MPPRRIHPMSGGVGRIASILGLAVLTSGCASWRATEQTPQQLFAAERPSKVRVTTQAGEQTVLRRPRVLGNVLAGFEDECVRRFGNDTNQCEEVGIAVFDISLFEVQERGWASIVLPGVGGLLTAWLLANR